MKKKKNKKEIHQHHAHKSFSKKIRRASSHKNSISRASQTTYDKLSSHHERLEGIDNLLDEISTVKEKFFDQKELSKEKQEEIDAVSTRADAFLTHAEKTTDKKTQTPSTAQSSEELNELLAIGRDYKNDPVLFEEKFRAWIKENDPPLKQKALVTASDYFTEGLRDQALDLPEKALENFSEAIQLEPDNEKFYMHRAYVNVDLKKYDNACKDINKLIQLAPHQYKGYAQRGDLYLILQDVPAALDDYSKAIHLEPYHSSLYCRRAHIYRLLHQLDNALNDLNQAIRLDPKNSDAYVEKGWLFRLQENDTASLDAYTQAIRIYFE